ncbi:MAG TPA: glycosyltransferase [Pyrinomonadaceae bacterium]|jgi:glycosyltransferase involved in cell wall biosynthesis
MRIVRIIARLNVGGPARHVAWLTAALARAGHESVLVSGTVAPGEDDMSYFAAALGVEPVVIPEMSREISPKDVLTIWKLYRLLVRLKPDIVHTHTAKAGTAGRLAGMLYRWLTPAALAGRPRRCRFVHTYHGHVFHSYYGALKTRIFLSIERALARLSTDRIVVISPQQLREIHGEFRVGRREQFAVIPLGLETEVFDGRETRRRAARARFGANETDDVLLVGIVGRLTEVKNHRLFLEAAARTKRTREEDVRQQKHEGQRQTEKPAPGAGGSEGRAPRMRFLVVGDGHLRRELEEYARTLGLDDAEVTFTGTLRDPENFYAALDVVALSSLNEGTPLTLIEAMASERAVVATAVGGVVDLLGEAVGAESTSEHEGGYRICERGVRVGSGDVEGMASALVRLAADEELRRELGARGRAYVEREFSVRRLVADVTKLYEELTRTQAGKEKGSGAEWAKEEAERRSAF